MSDKPIWEQLSEIGRSVPADAWPEFTSLPSRHRRNRAPTGSFMNDFLLGMRERWTVDQWRAATDAARRK